MNTNPNKTINKIAKDIISAEGTPEYEKVISDVLIGLYNMKGLDIGAIENRWIRCCNQVNEYFESHGKENRLPFGLFRRFVNTIRTKKRISAITIIAQRKKQPLL